MCLYLLYLSYFDNIINLFDFFLILCFISNQNHIRKKNVMLLVSQSCYYSIVVCLRQYKRHGVASAKERLHIRIYVCMCKHFLIFNFMLLSLSHIVMENPSYVQLFINDPLIIYFLKYFTVSC